MFSYIKNTIDKITISSSQWVFGENKFTRDRKFSFNDYITFLHVINVCLIVVIWRIILKIH